MHFCPGMGPLGNPWLSLFAEPTDNKNFSERKSMFVATKLEMILILANFQMAKMLRSIFTNSS
jgi:hypothetical protein